MFKFFFLNCLLHAIWQTETILILKMKKVEREREKNKTDKAVIEY